METQSLEGKVVLVTGSTRGIGKAIADAYQAEGARVFRNGRMDNQFPSHLVKGNTVYFDVRDREAVIGGISTIYNINERLDILVNNAGINEDSKVGKMENVQWDDVLATNLTGAFNCTRIALPYLRQNKGQIIYVSSIMANDPKQGVANYAASKAGVEAFARVVSLEEAGNGISVLVVSPGFAETDMIARLSAEVRQRIQSQIPNGQFIQPERIAQEVVQFSKVRGSLPPYVKKDLPY
ncbi:MAG: SDR family NAD(P)-dependent oxidoreductase [Nanoarchaeota archaeon]